VEGRRCVHVWKRLLKHWTPPPRVCDIFNITVKYYSGSKQNTNTFMVTCKTAFIPKHLKIGYIMVLVSIYTSNPQCCFKCQKMGMVKRLAAEVRPVPRWSSWPQQWQLQQWTQMCKLHWQSLCLQQKLPQMDIWKRVQEVKAERNNSFIEARKIVSVEGQSRSAPGNCSAAAVVGTKSMPIHTHSVPVQTDLTCPQKKVIHNYQDVTVEFSNGNGNGRELGQKICHLSVYSLSHLLI